MAVEKKKVSMVSYANDIALISGSENGFKNRTKAKRRENKDHEMQESGRKGKKLTSAKKKTS